jgi:hypothetical protein
MFMKVALAFGVVVVSALAQECPELTQPQLCGTENVVIELDECNSTTIPIPEFPPCCRLQTEQPKKCDDPEATQSCRSVEISTGLCPGNDENCCFRKEMSMKLFLEFETSNKTCCSKCRCYGDPHCESFDGTADTWVICDARTPIASNPSRCPMERATCLAQTDHLGKPCNWTNPSNGKWNIGMLGSPCVVTNSDTPPFMILYEADNIKITLNQGERSVIKHLIIEDHGETYVLGAEDCFTAAYSPTPASPWRDSVSVGAPEPDKPEDWLPKKWTWGPIDGEDVLWNVDNLASLIDMTVRCTRTVEVIHGRRNYGAPRLNVDIVEPLNWMDSDQRPNSGGFCLTGSIDKQGSHENTDRILSRNWCTSDVELLDVAKLLCGPGTTNAGVNLCKTRWCTTPTANAPSRPAADVTQCTSDINQFGWDVTYCATKLLQAPATARDCVNNEQCRTCMNDRKDFGWPALVAKYDKGFSTGNDCVKRAELPPDLPGFCTKGVRVQYYDRAADEWITQFAIPSDTCLDGGFVIITTETDPALFENPMRIIQCSEPKGTCLTNKCATEIGFSAKIELDVQTSKFENVWTLFEAGLLICDPKLWPNKPQGCLGFTPEKMCPCPDRRRQLLTTGK